MAVATWLEVVGMTHANNHTLLIQQRVYFSHAVCLASSTLFVGTELGTQYLLLTPSCKMENKFSCLCKKGGGVNHYEADVNCNSC